MKNEKSRKQEGLLWIRIGVLLIAAALFLVAYNLYDGLRAKRSAMQAAEKLVEYLAAGRAGETSSDGRWDPESQGYAGQTAIPDYVLNPNMEMPVETINGLDYIGVLRIPSLELELPIISQWSYPYMKTAPCRYSGSAYLNDLIICAHNYPAHFGNLKDLREGESVILTDMDENVFTYEMVEWETMQPTDIEEMESGDWDLTLFTCTVTGQSRLAFRCALVGHGTHQLLERKTP